MPKSIPQPPQVDSLPAMSQAPELSREMQESTLFQESWTDLLPAPMRRLVNAPWTVKSHWLSMVLSPIRKGFILIIGLTVVLIGIIMIVTPGPAIVVIPLGLAILATEFLWAKNLLHFSKEWIAKRYYQIRGDRPAAEPVGPKIDPNSHAAPAAPELPAPQALRGRESR